MKLVVLTFGIVKEITGGSVTTVELPPDITAGDLTAHLKEMYPALAKLRSLAVAVNGRYADAATSIKQGDEVALIPPVSGG
jgi:molybdopterin converting factor subunit 1